MRKGLFLFSAFIVFSQHILAVQGAEGGGGGAFIKAQFMSKAQTIARQLRVPGKNIHKINLFELDELLSKLDLSVSERVLRDKNGEPVDALNFPAGNKIILYIKSWKNILASDETVYVLIYHELISLLGVDDTNHKLSSQIKFTLPLWSCFAYCYFESRPFKSLPMVSEGDQAAETFKVLIDECLYPADPAPNDRFGSWLSTVWVILDRDTRGQFSATFQNSCVKN